MTDLVVFLCQECLSEGHESMIVTIDRTAEAKADDGEIVVAYEHICQRCGNRVGFCLDYGTLDLGLMRDEALEDSPNDFLIFGEGFV